MTTTLWGCPPSHPALQQRQHVGEQEVSWDIAEGELDSSLPDHSYFSASLLTWRIAVIWNHKANLQTAALLWGGAYDVPAARWSCSCSSEKGRVACSEGPRHISVQMKTRRWVEPGNIHSFHSHSSRGKGRWFYTKQDVKVGKNNVRIGLLVEVQMRSRPEPLYILHIKRSPAEFVVIF